ncbi:MAG: CDP-alcohol phosphatidyltransferase family protein [Acidobacteriota bacterium]
MPSVYNLKPAFQSCLRPAARWLARHSITANEVTVAAVMISSIQGAFIVWQPAVAWPLILMPVTLFIRLSLNAIDGILAREHGLASNLGVVLNEFGDLASDMMLYLPLALVPEVSTPLLVVVVCLALVSEAMGLVALQISGARGNEGPMGKSDRAVLFGALAFALGLGVASQAWSTGLLILTMMLLIATIANRAGSALRRAKRTRKNCI